MTGYEIWMYFCLSVTVLLILATLIVQIVVPELRNLCGALVRRYLASCFGSFVIALTLVPVYNIGSDLAEAFWGVAGKYFRMASALWLNVMSIEIWRRCRNNKSDQYVHSETRQKVSLVRYSIYAWGIPAIYSILIVGFRLYCSYYGYCIHGLRYGWTFHDVSFVIKFGFLICDACFHITTALAIRKFKKERAPLIDGVDNRQIENDKWFHSYVQLFLVVVTYTVLNLLPLAASRDGLAQSYISDFFAYLCTLDIVFGIAIIVIFVWRKDVRMSFSKRISQIMGRSGSTR